MSCVLDEFIFAVLFLLDHSVSSHRKGSQLRFVVEIYKNITFFSRRIAASDPPAVMDLAAFCPNCHPLPPDIKCFIVISAGVKLLAAMQYTKSAGTSIKRATPPYPLRSIQHDDSVVSL